MKVYILFIAFMSPQMTWEYIPPMHHTSKEVCEFLKEMNIAAIKKNTKTLEPNIVAVCKEQTFIIAENT